MRRLLVAACAVIAASACSSSSTGPSASSATHRSVPDSTMISSTSVVLTAAKTTLKCGDQIGWPRTLPAAYSAVLGRAGLPTGRALGGVRLPNHKFWAKQGLLIKPGTSFELIVPAAWASRLTIGWGNPGKPTTHLWVTGCRSTKAAAHWLAFAGGFTINTPACVPLVVKAANQRRTVHIGVGKACPGQSPPPK